MTASGPKRIAFVVLWSVCLGSSVVIARTVESPNAEAATTSNLEVFVVPHSHMDVGWVYTVAESMHAYAANVYTTVIQELTRSTNRRFIAVEQEFFRLWWNDVATDKQKNQTKQLVSNGQLEFVIGGQVMHDEAVTELSAIIQQMTEGHAFIYETFGVRPRFGWHVDPFGASAATPSLFALMGFNAHLTSRIDYDKKAEMMKNKGLQFVWRASPSLGRADDMFTHVMDNYSYCVPGEIPPFSDKPGYMWNGVAKFPNPPSDGIYPNMSDPVNKTNVEQYSDFMVANIRQRAAWFKSPFLLWPWGCDKQFFNASVQFSNMEKLLSHINQQREKYRIKIRYATLSEFFTTLYNNGSTWDVKDSGDFLPYSTARQEAWTGFYTSRSELKGLARRSQAMLRAGETLFSVYTHLYNVTRSLNTTAMLENLKQLRWATAEVQHHDGITGTEAPAVRDMYTTHLDDGSNATSGVITDILSELMQLGAEREEGLRTQPHPTGTDSEQRVRKKAVPITVYNSLGWRVRRALRIQVDAPNVTVMNSKGETVKSQLDPPVNPSDPYHLFFFADLPPVGYETYVLLYFDAVLPSATQPTIRKYEMGAAKTSRGTSSPESNNEGSGSISIENGCYQITYDETSGLLSSIRDKRSGVETSISARFMEYSVYHNVLYGQPSNNYIFRPYGSAQDIHSYRTNLTVVTGDVVNETRQEFYGLFDEKSRYSVRTRLVSDPAGGGDNISCGHIEMDFDVGPLSMNKEAIFRFSTSMASRGNLYADVNAYQTMNRTRIPGTTTAQNAFPMVSTAYIEDTEKDLRLMLLADRSHGVSSHRDGDLEVMLHRRLVNNEFEDHNYNLTLTEPSVTKPSFWLLLGNRSITSQLRHRSWLQLENSPVISRMGPGWDSKEEIDWASLGRSPRQRVTAAFSAELPPNVHLLTFKTPGWHFNDSEDYEPLDTGDMEPNLDRILLRLQHLYEVGEHPILSQPVMVDIQAILAPLGEVIRVNERSLTTVWNIARLQRWRWKTNSGKNRD
ncbi:epididymis-specific alpha-mannosidase-like [Diadema antillarum]|uniref:epididymis-specific alpha-mannosidase-like n=1 Tax=Diadema antillarum TaxID=105358 RepID=UPI003A8BDD3D